MNGLSQLVAVAVASCDDLMYRCGGCMWCAVGGLPQLAADACLLLPACCCLVVVLSDDFLMYRRGKCT
jgi:hypothetical protein